MSMTPAQLAILKADILADPELVAWITAGRPNQITAVYNADAAPDFIVWKTQVRTEDVFDSITWSALTPADNPDSTQDWANRSLACQGKQFNLQTILTGRQSISGAKPAVRAGLQDALTNVPSGTAGALVNAGWAAVKATLSRKATRGEKLFATGAGTTASPATLGIDGLVTDADVEYALRG